jgi:hypothetical protein
MTRQQAKENLIAIGIAEPTEEQVTNYLNQMGAETKREKDRADKYKADADLKAELQKQLDDLNNQNLSDIEKANKDTQDALNKVAELEKKLLRTEQLGKLAEKGIIGETAEKLLSEDGVLDFEVLGQIISEREKAAATAKEQEIANKQTNPGGGSASNSSNETQADVENAKSITFGAVSKDAQSTIDYYK